MRLLPILLLALLLAAAVASPQENTVFRANVSLVHVDAEVVSAEGRIVDGLTRDDFRVLDERKEQPVLQIGRASCRERV